MSQPKKLSDVLAAAQHACALTPAEVAWDEYQEACTRRRQFLAIAAPDIRPEDVEEIVLGTLNPANPWLIRIKSWLESTTRVIILSGSVGSGKSVAASWAIAERGGRFVSAPDLVRISANFKRGEWNHLVGAPVLDIDDLGDETDPERLAIALKLLISARLPRRGKTIMTTNILAGTDDDDEQAETLNTRYVDEKLWSRVAQSYIFSSINAPDLRRHPYPPGSYPVVVPTDPRKS